MVRLKTTSLLMLLTLGLPIGAFAQAKPLCGPVFLTHSQRYDWLENESPERLAWIRQQNGKLNKSLKESPDKKAIENYVWTQFNNPRVLQTAEIRKGLSLTLHSMGLGKGTELVVQGTRSSKVLTSSLAKKENNSVSILSFSLSAKKDQVAVVFIKNGSIDNFWVEIYSLNTMETVSGALPMRFKDVAWTGADRLSYVADRSGNISTVRTFSTTDKTNNVDPDLNFIIQGGSKLSLVSYNGMYALVDTLGTLVPLKLRNGDAKFLDVVGSEFIIQTKTPQGFGSIEAVSMITGESRPVFTFVNRVFRNAAVKGKYIIADHTYGISHKFEIFDLQGHSIQTLDLPAGVNVETATWKEEGKTLELSFSNYIKKGMKQTLEIGKPLDMNAISLALHNDGDTQFKSEYLEVAAKDGAMIPVSLTYKADLNLNGENPALIMVYGGFAQPGHLHVGGPSPMNKLFLDKGGILVGPGVRGGNEKGEEWHSTATGADKKETTLDDMISVADFLKTQKYSKPEKIVTMGTSNGGFVVAGSALKSPGSFGLAIPISGVQDMLGKEHLDLKESWKVEYGNSNEAKDYAEMVDFSPVEFEIPQSKTQFLIIAGEDDGRVNAVHSYKLMKSLADQNANAQMANLKNSGHWVESPYYQNVLGWRVQSVIWTKIYQFLGLHM
jgi:prolyl oligopeptidase PreP (S9A serine peptidase family)